MKDCRVERCTFRWAGNTSKCLSFCGLESSGHEYRTKGDLLCLSDCQVSDEKQSVRVMHTPTAQETMPFRAFLILIGFSALALVLYAIRQCFIISKSVFVLSRNFTLSGFSRRFTFKALGIWRLVLHDRESIHIPQVREIAREARLKRARILIWCGLHGAAFLIAFRLFVLFGHKTLFVGAPACWSCYNSLVHPTWYTDEFELQQYIDESDLPPAVLFEIMAFTLLQIPSLVTLRNLDIANVIFSLMWGHKCFVMGDVAYTASAMWLGICRAVTGVGFGNSHMAVPLHALVSGVQLVSIFLVPDTRRTMQRAFLEMTMCGSFIIFLLFLERVDLNQATYAYNKRRDKQSLSLASGLLKVVCDVVVHLDAQLCIAEQCPTLATLLLHQTHGRNVLKHDFADFVCPGDRERFREWMATQSEESDNFGIHTCLMDASGGVVHVHLVAAFVSDQADDACYAIGINESDHGAFDKVPNLEGKADAAGITDLENLSNASESGCTLETVSESPGSYNGDQDLDVHMHVSRDFIITQTSQDFDRHLSADILGKALSRVFPRFPSIRPFLNNGFLEMRNLTPPALTNAIFEEFVIPTRHGCHRLDVSIVWCFLGSVDNLLSVIFQKWNRKQPLGTPAHQGPTIACKMCLVDFRGTTIELQAQASGSQSGGEAMQVVFDDHFTFLSATSKFRVWFHRLDGPVQFSSIFADCDSLVADLEKVFERLKNQEITPPVKSAPLPIRLAIPSGSCGQDVCNANVVWTVDQAVPPVEFTVTALFVRGEVQRSRKHRKRGYGGASAYKPISDRVTL